MEMDEFVVPKNDFPIFFFPGWGGVKGREEFLLEVARVLGWFGESALT